MELAGRGIGKIPKSKKLIGHNDQRSAINKGKESLHTEETKTIMAKMESRAGLKYSGGTNQVITEAGKTHRYHNTILPYKLPLNPVAV